MSTNQSTNDDLDRAIGTTIDRLKSLRIDALAFLIAPAGEHAHAIELLTEHLHALLIEQRRRLAPEQHPMADAYGESTMQRISDALTEIDHIRKEVRGVRSLSCLHKHVASPSINRTEGDALASALDMIEIRAQAVRRLFP